MKDKIGQATNLRLAPELGNGPLKAKIFIAIPILIAVLVATVTLLKVDREKNRGLTFGYYGDFNAIVHSLEQMPGIEIVKAGANHDIFLEEIGIIIKKDNDTKINLFFGQKESLRNTRGEKLSTELMKRIKQAMLEQTNSSIRNNRY